MKIYVFKTEAELDAYVGQQIIDVVKKNKQPVIGFATGETPLGTYRYLIDSYQKGNVDFSSLVAFNLDEYVGIDPSHPKSFASSMRQELFDQINIPKTNIYALNGNAKDMDIECQCYDQLIDQYPIDIQLLGVGMDGHIAYNEPGSPLDGGSHVVDLDQESIKSSLNYGFDTIEEVPTQGVTQGIGTIMKAKQLIMMAKGAKKSTLVKRMLQGEVSSDFPSSIIQRHNNVIVVLDEEAAKCLKEEEYERY